MNWDSGENGGFGSGKTWIPIHNKYKEINVENGGNIEAATEVGKLIAKKALEMNIETVVFDRGGYLYHGRVAALADGAREGGLKF